MSISHYLREIARGKDGARSLDAAQAEELLRQVFEGRVSDVQLGAFVIAMRIKGESPAELAGFVATAAFIDAALCDPSAVPRPFQCQVRAIAARLQHMAQPLERAA